MNKWCGTGRISRLGGVQFDSNGGTYLLVTIACDKIGSNADFIDCVVFGDQTSATDNMNRAERFYSNAYIGREIEIEGPLMSRLRRDRDTGKQFKSLTIRVDTYLLRGMCRENHDKLVADVAATNETPA